MSWEFFGTSLAAFFTLAIYSYLYKDNPFYRIAEHIFAGISAGYYVGLIYHSVIRQQLILPLFLDSQYLLIVPGILGILMFSRLFPKMAWLSRISLAFVIGNTAGIYVIQQFHGLIIPQVRSTFLSLTDFSGVVMVIGVISTLIYFYFSKEHKGAFGIVAKIGIWFIMIAFGASFGYTVMGRVSLLIGRAQFLMIDWLKIIR